jgi:hypothetical protein
MTPGAYLSSAGVWTNASDRALKHDFRPLKTRSVLQKVARMPIESWSYKAEPSSIRHVGPAAQDFYSAFGLGLDDRAHRHDRRGRGSAGGDPGPLPAEPLPRTRKCGAAA